MATSSLPDVTDVLVCGAGPAGLATAISLQHHDPSLNITVVEACKNGTTESRAVVIHSATLEALEPLGVSEQLIAAGFPVSCLQIQSGSGPLFKQDFGALSSETKYPFGLSIQQPHTEITLTKILQERGISVHRDLKVSGMQPLENTSGFQVTFENGQSIKAQYVVGSDGGHSTVRKLADIGFNILPPGDSLLLKMIGNEEPVFAIADITFDQALPPNIAKFPFLTLGSKSFMIFAPLLDHIPTKEEKRDVVKFIYRVAFLVPKDETDRAKDLSKDVAYLQDKLNKYLRFFDPKHKHSITKTKDVPTVANVSWSSVFHIRFRKAATFHKQYANGGVVILVGDAAHVHSPTGGQGMNLGLNDAIEAGAAIVKHIKSNGSDIAILEAFTRRRAKISSTIISETKIITFLWTLQNPVAIFLRNLAFRLLGMSKKAQKSIALQASGLRFLRDPKFF